MANKQDELRQKIIRSTGAIGCDVEVKRSKKPNSKPRITVQLTSPKGHFTCLVYRQSLQTLVNDIGPVVRDVHRLWATPVIVPDDGCAITEIKCKGAEEFAQWLCSQDRVRYPTASLTYMAKLFRNHLEEKQQ